MALERKCKNCKIKKSINEFPFPLDRTSKVCKKCKDVACKLRYFKEKKDQWNAYYSNYAREYRKDPVKKCRNQLATRVFWLKNNTDFGDKIKKTENCGYCGQQFKKEFDKKIKINDEFIIRYLAKNEVMSKTEYINAIDTGDIIICHHTCMSDKRKKPMMKSKPEKKPELGPISEINEKSLTFLYFASNRKIEHESLGQIILNPSDDPELIKFFKFQTIKYGEMTYQYTYLKKFVYKFLIEYFQIDFDQLWESKDELTEKIRNYIFEKLQDNTISEILGLCFRKSIEEITLPIHLKDHNSIKDDANHQS